MLEGVSVFRNNLICTCFVAIMYILIQAKDSRRVVNQCSSRHPRFTHNPQLHRLRQVIFGALAAITLNADRRTAKIIRLDKSKSGLWAKDYFKTIYISLATAYILSAMRFTNANGTKVAFSIWGHGNQSYDIFISDLILEDRRQDALFCREKSNISSWEGSTAPNYAISAATDTELVTDQSSLKFALAAWLWLRRAGTATGWIIECVSTSSKGICCWRWCLGRCLHILVPCWDRRPCKTLQ